MVSHDAHLHIDATKVTTSTTCIKVMHSFKPEKGAILQATVLLKLKSKDGLHSWRVDDMRCHVIVLVFKTISFIHLDYY